MAASRPIVATSAGGIPEIVEDGVTGLLVPPRDHTALAAAIVRALNDEEGRRRMGGAGFARVNERFTVDRMVERTAEVYTRLTSAKSEV
jgi:glycosyltransferase involved in cell wall biosynthesis